MPDLRIQPNLKGRRRNAVDFAAAVQGLLAGGNGFAFDPTDIALLWQDSAKATPVSGVGQPIGAIDTKFGATTYTLTEIDPSRGLWSGSSWEGDGVDDRLIGAGSLLALLNNVPGVSFVGRVRFDTIDSQPALVSFSTVTGTNARFVVDVLSTGAIRLRVRRLDADVENALSSAAGVIVAGNTYTIRAEVDYITGAASVWVNGSSVIATTITGTGANSEASNSARMRISLALSNTLSQFLDGRLGRFVMAPRVMTAGEAASCAGYVEASTP